MHFQEGFAYRFVFEIFMHDEKISPVRVKTAKFNLIHRDFNFEFVLFNQT